MAALQIELATSGWRALEELRSSGAVRGVGAGINAVGLIPRFLDLLDLDFFLVAQDYNLLDHDVLDQDFPRCEAAGVAIIVGALFASGILATGGRDGATYRYAEPPPEVLQRVQAMEAVCGRHGVELATARGAVPPRPPAGRRGDPRRHPSRPRHRQRAAAADPGARRPLGRDEGRRACCAPTPRSREHSGHAIRTAP